MLWRRAFGASYTEAMRTPIQAMHNDFEMAGIEEDVKAMRAAQKKQANMP